MVLYTNLVVIHRHGEAIASELCENLTILMQCKLMNVTGVREDMMKVVE